LGGCCSSAFVCVCVAVFDVAPALPLVVLGSPVFVTSSLESLSSDESVSSPPEPGPLLFEPGPELSSSSSSPDRTNVGLSPPEPESAAAGADQNSGVAARMSSAHSTANAVRGFECWSGPGSPAPSARRR
jgi:hypothetical protein